MYLTWHSLVSRRKFLSLNVIRLNIDIVHLHFTLPVNQSRVYSLPVISNYPQTIVLDFYTVLDEIGKEAIGVCKHFAEYFYWNHVFQVDLWIFVVRKQDDEHLFLVARGRDLEKIGFGFGLLLLQPSPSLPFHYCVFLFAATTYYFIIVRL